MAFQNKVINKHHSELSYGKIFDYKLWKTYQEVEKGIVRETAE